MSRCPSYSPHKLNSPKVHGGGQPRLRNYAESGRLSFFSKYLLKLEIYIKTFSELFISMMSGRKSESFFSPEVKPRPNSGQTFSVLPSCPHILPMLSGQVIAASKINPYLGQVAFDPLNAPQNFIRYAYSFKLNLI